MEYEPLKETAEEENNTMEDHEKISFIYEAIGDECLSPDDLPSGEQE